MTGPRYGQARDMCAPFAALGSPLRMHMSRLIEKEPGLSGRDLGILLDRAASPISQNLAVLADAGIVAVEQDAQCRRNTLTDMGSRLVTLSTDDTVHQALGHGNRHLIATTLRATPGLTVTELVARLPTNLWDVVRYHVPIMRTVGLLEAVELRRGQPVLEVTGLCTALLDATGARP